MRIMAVIGPERPPVTQERARVRRRSSRASSHPEADRAELAARARRPHPPADQLRLGLPRAQRGHRVQHRRTRRHRRSSASPAHRPHIGDTTSSTTRSASVSTDITPPHPPRTLGPHAPETPRPVPPAALAAPRRGGRLPARAVAAVAVAADPQRRHHRQRHRQGRHRATSSRSGAGMLGVTLVQVACSITAVYFGAKVAMRVGRDLRGAIFHQVGEFSEREVSKFGAPVADHPQHERRAAGADARADDLHAAGLRADPGDRRHHPGDAAGHPALLAHRGQRPVAAGRGRPHHRAHGPAVPQDAGAHRPGEPGAARAAHRHPGGARVRARGRRDRPVPRRPTTRSPTRRCGPAGCSR